MKARPLNKRQPIKYWHDGHASLFRQHKDIIEIFMLGIRAWQDYSQIERSFKPVTEKEAKQLTPTAFE